MSTFGVTIAEPEDSRRVEYELRQHSAESFQQPLRARKGAWVLGPGWYEIRLRLRGYCAFTRWVHVWPLEESVVEVELSPDG